MIWIELNDANDERHLKCPYCRGYVSSLYYITAKSVEEVKLDLAHYQAMCVICSSYDILHDRPAVYLIVDGLASKMGDYKIMEALDPAEWQKRNSEPEFPAGEFGNEETRYSKTPYNNLPDDHWSVQ